MEDPTNREIMYEINDIQKKVEDINTKALPEIKGMVKLTNGSVAEVVKWKERMTGGAYVVLIVVVPIMSWALYKLSTLDHTIDNAVSNTLRANVSNIDYAK